MDINKNNECIICYLSFSSKEEFLKHNLTSVHLKRTRELIDDEDEDSLIYKAEPKTEIKPKTETKTKTETKPKTETTPKTEIKTETEPKRKTETKAKSLTEDNIYTRIKYENKECNETFRSKVPLTSHSYSHNRNFLEDTEDHDINSTLNMRNFFITDKAGNYIEYIDEAINFSVEEIKNCY